MTHPSHPLAFPFIKGGPIVLPSPLLLLSLQAPWLTSVFPVFPCLSFLNRLVCSPPASPFFTKSSLLLFFSLYAFISIITLSSPPLYLLSLQTPCIASSSFIACSLSLLSNPLLSRFKSALSSTSFSFHLWGPSVFFLPCSSFRQISPSLHFTTAWQTHAFIIPESYCIFHCLYQEIIKLHVHNFAF